MRFEILCYLPRQASFAHHVESVVSPYDLLDVDGRVARDHGEQGGIGVAPLVLGGRERDALGALEVRALAEDLERRRTARSALLALFDALVHLPKERLVHRQPFLARGQRVAA